MFIDFYNLLHVEQHASHKEIVKAYRRCAFLLHPDRNPNNPNATLQFRQVYNAYEILSNDISRLEYDKIYDSEKYRHDRLEKESSVRKELRDNLKAREKKASENGKKTTVTSFDERLKNEIVRLRQQFAQESRTLFVVININMDRNVSKEELLAIFSKYGDVSTITINDLTAQIKYFSASGYNNAVYYSENLPDYVHLEDSVLNKHEPEIPNLFSLQDLKVLENIVLPKLRVTK